jgi:hypothetical protein
MRVEQNQVKAAQGQRIESWKTLIYSLLHQIFQNIKSHKVKEKETGRACSMHEIRNAKSN